MLSLLSSRLGLVVKSLAGLSCTQTARCISLPNALNFRFTTARWFSEDKNVINPQKSPSILDLPKRPLTAFLRFSVEQRPLITAKHPDVSLPKRSRMIGEKWRELTDAERQVYRDAYKHDYMKYSENVKKYKASLDPLDLRLLKNIGRQKLENKKRKMLLKDLKASGPPKHPRNSYLLFFSENFHKCKEDSFIGKVHEMMSRWKKLSSKEKQAYKQLFEDDKIRYINELKAWEEQMREIGREDLIQFFMRNKRVSADKGLKEKENKIPARQRNTQPRKQKKS